MLKNLGLFYEMNKDLFAVNCNTHSEKKKIINTIYELLDYTNFPSLGYESNYFDGVNNKLCRGISAQNKDLLNQFLDNFVSGAPFYGGRASLYEAGIYTVMGNSLEMVKAYATDGGTNGCGAVIESILASNTMIIELKK